MKRDRLFSMLDFSQKLFAFKRVNTVVLTLTLSTGTYSSQGKLFKEILGESALGSHDLTPKSFPLHIASNF
jgi:ABC-type uncharacterized transport system permease subunit